MTTTTNGIKIIELNRIDRCAVYILYDSVGTCLYVGASKFFEKRIADHKARQAWGSFIHKAEIIWVDDKENLFSMERDCIREYTPLFNVMCNPQHDKEAAQAYLDKASVKHQKRSKSNISSNYVLERWRAAKKLDHISYCRKKNVYILELRKKQFPHLKYNVSQFYDDADKAISARDKFLY